MHEHSRRMSHTWSVLLGVAALASAACDTIDVDEIHDHARAWREENITDYTYVYREFCFCDPGDLSGHRVEVRDGRALNAVGWHSGISFPDTVLTIDDLFERVLDLAEADADEFEIHYDATRNFIDELHLDPDDDAQDDEYGLEVRCFSLAQDGCPVRTFTAEECVARPGEVTVIGAAFPGSSCSYPFEHMVGQVEPGVSVCCSNNE